MILFVYVWSIIIVYMIYLILSIGQYDPSYIQYKNALQLIYLRSVMESSHVLLFYESDLNHFNAYYF